MKPSTNNITVIFDGLCSVCCLFKRFVERRTGRFEFIPYQAIDFDREYRNIGLENAKHAVQMVNGSGTVISAGKAVGEMLKRMSFFWKIIGIVITLPLLIFVTEYFYRLVADHRAFIASLLSLRSRKSVCD